MIKPPSFPLTQAEFAAALRTGHGRAIQQIDKCGASGLHALIIKACMACHSYDPQCEAARAPWLFSIVERAKLNAVVVQAIKAMEGAPSLDNYDDSALRSELLKELAASGMEEARRLLYASLAIFPNTASVIGAEEIIDLDGMDGLIYVARRMGQWLQADPDFWVDDYLITRFDASTGVQGGLEALECEAVADSDVANYLAGLRKTRDSRGDSSTDFDITDYTAADIVAHVIKNPRDPCHWFRSWGAQARSDQREIVFAALLASDEPEHVMRLFRCFVKASVPRFDKRLIRWIRHPDEKVQRAAVRALVHVTHRELRLEADRLIADGDIANGVALLKSNFAEGDSSACVKHLTGLDDIDEIHRLIMPLLSFCEAHPGEKALDCLLHIYELSPCSICRRGAVTALIKTNLAPGWLLEESAFDADPDTRVLVDINRSAKQP